MPEKPVAASPVHRWRRLSLQAALLVAVLLALAWRGRPDGLLHIFFLNTPGDAMLVRSPGGRYLLIDGGADPAALSAALGRHLPFWRRALDGLVLTSPDSRRLPGQVAALARYRAAYAVAPVDTARGAMFAAWRAELDAARTPLRVAHAGDRWLFDGVVFEVLATGDGDTGGMLLRLDYGATAVMFSHAASAADESLLAHSGRLRQAAIVAFPWQRSPHIPYLAALNPQVIVLTDGHQADVPLEETYAERAVRGERLLHERIDGTVERVITRR